MKVYFPGEEQIRVHQNRVKPCPEGFPPGYYWYGSRRVGPGRPPKWVQKVLSSTPDSYDLPDENSPDVPAEDEVLTPDQESPQADSTEESNRHDIQSSQTRSSPYELTLHPASGETEQLLRSGSSSNWGRG